MLYNQPKITTTPKRAKANIKEAKGDSTKAWSN